MLQLTAEARQALSQILTRANSAPGLLLRLVADDGSIELTPSTAQPDDVLFSHDDVPVLAVDQEVARQLDNRRMEAELEGDDVRLTLTRTDDDG